MRLLLQLLPLHAAALLSRVAKEWRGEHGVLRSHLFSLFVQVFPAPFPDLKEVSFSYM